ncbi:MAG: hypothetical protein K0U20_07875 [Proteobacteria bacterium]|nr:hypothetical protein [Pseudomonadota bacterium]
MNDDIYRMELNETIECKGLYITRVPGGWVYDSDQNSACFVPYNEEFKKEHKITNCNNTKGE